MIIVVFWVHTFLGDHDAKEDAFVFLQEVPFGGLLEGEVVDSVKLDRDVGCLEDLDDAFWIRMEMYW